jgi:hypothetical protein
MNSAERHETCCSAARLMRRSTETGVLQVAASQYLSALIIGFVNSATIQPVIAIERTVFHRERAAGMRSLSLLRPEAVINFFCAVCNPSTNFAPLAH